MLGKEGRPKTPAPTMRTRRLVLERDGYRCVRCGKPVSDAWPGFSIHHRRLRSHPFRALHEPANLITLCGSGTTGCHGWVHSHPREAMRHGWMVHGYASPAATPVSTPHGMLLLDDDGNARSARIDNNTTRCGNVAQGV